MVSGMPLLVALFATGTATSSTSPERPICVEPASLLDAPSDAVDEAPAEDRAPPDQHCSPAPDWTAVVIDCNDARASIWVSDMIGSCDMPRGTTQAVRAAPASRSPIQCDGFSCDRSAPPIRGVVDPGGDWRPLGHSAILLSLVPETCQVVEDRFALPASAEARRLERPPRSFISLSAI